jgi:hypothetical protein
VDNLVPSVPTPSNHAEAGPVRQASGYPCVDGTGEPPS